MKRSPILLTMLLVACSAMTHAQDKTEQKIRWYTIKEVEELAKTEPRKVMIDVYTDWCGWCKKMDRETFGHPVIAEYINKNYYPVKFNAESKDEITFLGKTYKFVQSGARGYHELAAGLLNGQLQFPSIAYLNENLELLGAVAGYRSAREMEPLLNYIVEDKFEVQSLAEYQKNFSSKIE
jgi:thioredoxin-related protein